MEKEQFNQGFQKLTPRRKEVLELFLSGEGDPQIAQLLHIAENTVRQHIRKVCIDFGLTDDLEGDRTSQRHNLVALFAKYKPELVGQETTPEEEAPEPEIDKETRRDPNFVGREKAITDLNTLIEEGTRCILILSPGGVGKTVLAERYLQQRFRTVVRFDIAKERQNVSSAESLVEEKLRSLGEEPGREFGVSLARLRSKLESESIGVLVDNLEPALGEGGRFIENHRSYVELLRVLCGSSVRSITLITSRENVAENLDIEVYPLERLSLAAWEEYFQQKAIDRNTSILGEIHQAYQGNALAMKMLRSRIAADHDHSIANYWTSNRTEEGVVVEQAIENLIIEQFNRLQEVCLTAYQLLYRMGCFRFQDVPTVPRDGLLCLLWGIPEREGVRAIWDLGDRGLVERVNGEYKLHPLIRQEAVKRLQDSEDWEQANRTAAEFWTDWVKSIETVADAQQAIEAYHHYLSIKDFDSASKVIDKERDHEFETAEPLATSVNRLGLLEQISNYLCNIIENANPSHSLVTCYNIMGDIEWLRGNIHQAIKFHYQGEKLADLVYQKIDNSTKDSLLCKRFFLVEKINRALCYLDLLEIQEADKIIIEALEDHKIFLLKNHENIKNLSSKFSLEFSLDRVFFMIVLAVVRSHQGNCEEAMRYLSQFEKSDLQGRTWGYGYGLLYLAFVYKQLKQHQISLNIYNEVLIFAEQSNFAQVKGKASTGLAELSRIQKHYETAFSYHTQAIDILEKLGAKCDLAEAYYQLGLTYKETGELAQSQDYFNRAIELWEKINAPKQIARVRGAMGNEQ